MNKKSNVSLDELVKWASTRFKGSIVLKDAAEDVKWVPTGLPSFDYLFGKGIPLGRLIELFGKEQSGKTTISYWLLSKVLEYTKKPLLYIDAEQSLSYEWLEANGLSDDLARRAGILDNYSDWSVISQEVRMEVVFNLIEKFVESGVVGSVLLDSISMLIPESQVDADLGDLSKDFATYTRVLTLMLKRITPILSKMDVPMFVINQVREVINAPAFGERERTPGGKMLKHIASVRIKVWTQQQLKSGDKSVGTIAGLRAVKNKVGPPYRTIYAVIYYDDVNGKIGFDPVASLIYDLVLKRVLSPSGAWYSVGDKKFQGIDALISAARADSSLFDELLSIARKFYNQEGDKDEVAE